MLEMYLVEQNRPKIRTAVFLQTEIQMPAFMTFYPLGNADTTLIRLANDDLVHRPLRRPINHRDSSIYFHRG
jgi:hypothetical protein